MEKGTLVFAILGVLCIMTGAEVSALPIYVIDDKVVDSLLLQALSGKSGQAWLSDILRIENAPHKRNSEIINSLLGIPKVINDAGRK